MSEPTLASVQTWLAAPMKHDVSEAIERLRRAPDVQQALDQGIVGHEGIRPDRRDQLSFGYEAAGTLGKIAEHLEGFWPELPLFPAPIERGPIDIDQEFTEPQLARA